MKRSYSVNGPAALLLFIVCLALGFGISALVAWILSATVSYVFSVDFGFWKAFCLMIIASIIGNFFRSRRAD